MTCKDCINYQKTQIMEWDLTPYLKQGYTWLEASDMVNKDKTKPLYDCPFADDWCEYDTPINVLCDNKFEPKEKEQN